MIILDQTEINQLLHFHRVITILHGGTGKNAYFTKYLESIYETKDRLKLLEKNKNFKTEWASRSDRQKFGDLQFCYVPLSTDVLPWAGYDLDWKLIGKMEHFECRMMKIQER
jgi:hypothetical protein